MRQRISKLSSVTIRPNHRPRRKLSSSPNNINRPTSDTGCTSSQNTRVRTGNMSPTLNRRSRVPHQVDERETAMRRLLQFRDELVILWRAFLAPETPLWLKALMLLIPAYLLNPLDLIPDFIPVVGWLDDVVIIPLLVALLVRLVPQPAPRTTRSDGANVIDGDYRRLLTADGNPAPRRGPRPRRR